MFLVYANNMVKIVIQCRLLALNDFGLLSLLLGPQFSKSTFTYSAVLISGVDKWSFDHMLHSNPRMYLRTLINESRHQVTFLIKPD